MRCWLLATSLVLCVVPAWADEGDGFDTDPFHGLVVTGTLKQVIGYFNSHGRPEVGDALEIDLRELPKEKLTLTRPAANGGSSYIPLVAPLKIQRVKYGKGKAADYTTVYLESSDPDRGTFRLKIIASGREKGSEVRMVLFYDDEFIGSMAEAVGTLK